MKRTLLSLAKTEEKRSDYLTDGNNPKNGQKIKVLNTLAIKY